MRVIRLDAYFDPNELKYTLLLTNGWMQLGPPQERRLSAAALRLLLRNLELEVYMVVSSFVNRCPGQESEDSSAGAVVVPAPSRFGIVLDRRLPIQNCPGWDGPNILAVSQSHSTRPGVTA